MVATGVRGKFAGEEACESLDGAVVDRELRLSMVADSAFFEVLLLLQPAFHSEDMSCLEIPIVVVSA
jgi:hypothetical protein